jgi:hypothetical protein
MQKRVTIFSNNMLRKIDNLCHEICDSKLSCRSHSVLQGSILLLTVAALQQHFVLLIAKVIVMRTFNLNHIGGTIILKFKEKRAVSSNAFRQAWIRGEL